MTSPFRTCTLNFCLIFFKLKTSDHGVYIYVFFLHN